MTEDERKALRDFVQAVRACLRECIHPAEWGYFPESEMSAAADRLMELLK